MIHNANIALSCNSDGNDFIQNTPLNDHISSVHERKKPYTSHDCNASFFKKGYLNEHISSNHENKKKMQLVPLTDARFQMVIENWKFMVIRSLWNVNFVALLILVKVI